MITGIYKITNKKNQKIYIGSSENIIRRWSHHVELLENNHHHSIILQRAWNKYTLNSFTFEIIEVCSKENLIQREQYYLDILLKAQEYINKENKFFIEKGYNIKPTAESNLNFKHSYVTLLKINKTRGLESVLKVNLNGNIINKYNFQSEAAIDNNLSKSAIYKALKTNKCPKGKDYYFVFENEYSPSFVPEKYKAWNKGKTGLNFNSGKAIYCYDIYNNFYKKFNSVKDCAEHFNTYSGTISKRLNKQIKKALFDTNTYLYNFFDSEQNELNKKILDLSNIGNIAVYDLFNNLIGISNPKELEKKLKTSKVYISNCLRNNKICKFYKFKDYEDIVQTI